MTTRKGHDCYLTLFHFATSFSSSHQMASADTITNKKPQINPHYSLWRVKQDSPQWLVYVEFQYFADTPMSHSVFQQDYPKIRATESNSGILKGETACSYETSGKTHYMNRCNNPEDHHLTILKLHDASIECSVAEQRRPDLPASAFTQSHSTTFL